MTEIKEDAGFTPGPWKVKSGLGITGSVNDLDVWTKHGRQITVRGANHIANAHLIAAAPDLVAALDEMVIDARLHRARFDEDLDPDSAEARAIAALAKARGE